MRLTELARSDAWPGARSEDGLTGLIAPTPVVLGTDLFLLVGRRDGAGASSLWALRVRDDLGDAELSPLPLAGEVPAYCRDGLVPTDARCEAGIRVTILFSGFRRMQSRHQLLTGAVRGRLGGGMAMEVDPLPLLEPVPGQHVVRAGATFSRSAPDSLHYAAGGAWVRFGDRLHPVSHLRHKTDETAADPGELLLTPAEDEFALTRPVEFVSSAGTMLFFSRRMRDGRYIQGLARTEADGSLVRCDEELPSGAEAAEGYMYMYPFRWGGRTLATVATSRLGEGGVVLVELEDVG